MFYPSVKKRYWAFLLLALTLSFHTKNVCAQTIEFTGTAQVPKPATASSSWLITGGYRSSFKNDLNTGPIAPFITVGVANTWLNILGAPLTTVESVDSNSALLLQLVRNVCGSSRFKYLYLFESVADARRIFAQSAYNQWPDDVSLRAFKSIAGFLTLNLGVDPCWTDVKTYYNSYAAPGTGFSFSVPSSNLSPKPTVSQTPTVSPTPTTTMKVIAIE